MTTSRTAEIAAGIYWVGGCAQDGGLHCNPYLIIEGNEGVLIDPGSVLDFEDVYENVCSLIALEKIKYVILQHQDPDLCSAVPLFEKAGAKFEIVTHWRTQTLVKYYGIQSNYYIINENNFLLKLKSGRTLGFVLTPYLHFPGAFTSYDYQTKTLFSSDLFGAFSYEWSLYAGEDYLEKMKTFHEHYMPSNSILRPVMEMFLGMDIAMIVPQHGSIIKGNVISYIKALRDLECGTLLNPIKRDLAKSGGYMGICSAVLKRLGSIFNQESVRELVADMELTLDDNLNITDYNVTGNELWNLIFEQILVRKGISWLIVIEPLTETLSKEYDIPMPEVFESHIKKIEDEASSLSEQNRMLKEVNTRLESSIQESQNKLIRCAITGLYNFSFFKNYLASEINSIFTDFSEQNPGLIVISLDNIERIEYLYGHDEVEAVQRNVVFILEALKEGNEMLFKLQGFTFAFYIPQTTKEAALVFAEKIRNSVATSEKFIEKVTASIGLAWLSEIREKAEYHGKLDEAFYNVVAMRTKIARNMGRNIVCSQSSITEYTEDIGKILIADSDEISVDVLKTALENINYRVIAISDGQTAMQIARDEKPLLIISEVMIPKMDGFLFREEMLTDSSTSKIPFIYLSYLKNDESVLRASSLGVEHYFKKPFMLSELMGVIQNRIKGEMR
ncbi:response regulator [Acetobacterium malicum]|uniref:Stage 0 sporulation protein A homolog n=1 Tax=Acetobacterium malicum TaxID=52692 RepID=A0ABR6YYQ0_9FIRM|nr:response regulator [Acetobacterium malicum]MBC3900326.1 response regulator [Acetobacterium malicum]